MSLSLEQSRLVSHEAQLRSALDRQVLALGAAWRSIPVEGRLQAASALSTEQLLDRLAAEFGLLTSTEVSARVSGRGRNREWASALRGRGGLLGFRRGTREYWYPGFQFDRAGAVLPVVPAVLQVAGQQGVSAMDVAIWFVSPSRWFPGDGRPVDALTDPELVLRAAESGFASQW